ncbi:alpha/beta hydrolase [Pararhizobium haloflavum]|uniref:alpha/beta hydrolase n=1 Tax=Pararhizobium haloflavum TaxID=2037914 RepID=UPI001FE1C8E9|nr:alpha/beta fold hydrolase [Pararhizobium haloflavum]
MARRWRIARRVLVIAAIAVAAIIIMGPRIETDTTIRFDPATIGPDVETYLQRREGQFADLRAGLQKQIVWADPATKARTALSIVYVHGFSASPGELRPLPDQVAAGLDANLFFTRLAGHGRSGDALGEASVNQWINDLAEAVEIGRRLGDRVVLVGTSTGASLVTWGAAQPALMADVVGAVLISPNFGVQAPGSFILTQPWGGHIAEWLTGPRRGFTPRNDLHARFWTSDYPTRALLPMAALVELANDAEIHNIQIPALFVYSSEDRIVRPDRTEAVAARWGAATQTLLVGENGDASNHVIAGDALSPETTDSLARAIVDYLRAVASPGGAGRASLENR